jgi:hypothetical protein
MSIVARPISRGPIAKMIEESLERRVPMRSASVRIVFGVDLDGSSGRLPSADREEFHRARKRAIIYSYATPIAWEPEGGRWTVPDEKYSVTTSRHQGIARRALARLGLVAPTA